MYVHIESSKELPLFIGGYTGLNAGYPVVLVLSVKCKRERLCFLEKEETALPSLLSFISISFSNQNLL